MAQLDQENLSTFVHELDPELESKMLSIIWQIRVTARDLNEVTSKLLDVEGLSYAPYRLLTSLFYNEQCTHPDGISPSELSQQHGTTRSTISSLVRSLESMGLVERHEDQTDRRFFIVKLTPSGRALARECVAKHFEAIKSWFHNVSLQEIDMLDRLLGQLHANIYQMKSAEDIILNSYNDHSQVEY